MVFMTFIVAFLKGHGTGPGGITAFWVVLGAASITGAFAWARPIVGLRGRRGPTMVLAVLGAGALLPLVFRSREAAMGSALLFGGPTLSVPRSTARRPSPPYCRLVRGAWTEQLLARHWSEADHATPGDEAAASRHEGASVPSLARLRFRSACGIRLTSWSRVTARSDSRQA